jgi:transcription elongation GreA/GreB family factor
MKRDSTFPHGHTVRPGAARLSGHPPPGEDGASVATLEADAVEIGSTVHIHDLRFNEREVYTLVPPDDADILHHRVSTLSPIGRALFGRRVGEIVEVDAPAGAFAVRIEQVRRPES